MVTKDEIIALLKEIDYFIKYTIQKQRPVFVTVLREEMKINYPYEAIRELAMSEKKTNMQMVLMIQKNLYMIQKPLKMIQKTT